MPVGLIETLYVSEPDNRSPHIISLFLCPEALLTQGSGLRKHLLGYGKARPNFVRKMVVSHWSERRDSMGNDETHSSA